MTVDKGKGEIPGQESFTFPPSEKPDVTKLIEEAQSRGILTPTTQLPLSKNYNIPSSSSPVEGKSFTFIKTPAGLTIESSWQDDKYAISLVPIALQIPSPGPHSQEWVFFFIPLGRNQTRVLIRDFAKERDITTLNIVLPLTEWPKEEYERVIDLLVNSRKILVYPPRYSGLKRHEYNSTFDIWNIYLRNKGRVLPEGIRQTLEKTKSTNQIQYLGQYAGT